MSDKTNFNRIVEGLAEVEAIVGGRAEPARVFPPADVDVKAIRVRTGLSQSAFAARFGFTVSAVRDWEQRRRRPEAAARVLLKVIDYDHETVERALAVA
ncbi:helix-turn-helix domain-containing protein [Phenylobacterium sp.]|uniref:helix-turn-helix domain-containing protein n=1 Tax=Phenylobacterium sp. TaxID=1871053 RepID=UPI0025FBBCDA|nr:helix-turn-helix domain-containing protein [Phenylobacterium sp.]MBX3484303.1 helix-turn-helix domain-containing protein [Phenylobacterium sp.]